MSYNDLFCVKTIVVGKYFRMVNQLIYISVLLALPVLSSGQDTDSTELIFDDSKVNNYDLHFYIADWADSLKFYYANDEQYLPARFVYRGADGDSVVLDSIGVRYKGNSSYTYAANSVKKPFKFKFDKYRDQHFSGVERLNFSNCVKDPSFMREKISYDIIMQYMPAPRAAFANISVDGTLIGLYTQVEQVDKIFLKRAFKKSKYNLYKSSDNGASLTYLGQNQSSYLEYYDLQTNESVDDWSAFIGMIDKLNNTTTTDFVKTMNSSLDLDNCLRYLAFNMVFSNFDSYTGSGRNFYMYDDSTSGKFALIPWDLNFAFGIYTNGWNVTTVDAVNLTNLNERPLIRRLLENDSLKSVYLSYIEEMIDGYASYDSVALKADKLKPLLEPYVLADTNKFHTDEQFLTNIESDVTLVEGPSRTVLPGIKSFITKRTANLRTQLASYLSVKNGVQRRSNGTFLMHTIKNSNGTVLLIKYEVLKDNSTVVFSIYDCKGAKISSFSEGVKSKGLYQSVSKVHLNLPAGFYTLKMNAGTVQKCVNSFIVW
jgi:spore coat protein CotH